MKRPWQVWLVFAICAGGAAIAMAWLTQQALRSDELRRSAQAIAELEQRVSLTLWRMDTELAPIVAEEVVRPPSAYRITIAPATQVRADSVQQQLQQLADQTGLPPAAATVPWPPVEPSAFVLLQFEARSDGNWYSPQVPGPPTRSGGPPQATLAAAPEDRRAMLAELANAMALPELMARLPDTPLPSLADVGSNFLAQKSANTSEELNTLSREFQFFQGNRAVLPKGADKVDNVWAEPTPTTAKGAASKAVQFKGEEDFSRRAQRYQSIAQQSLFNNDQRNPNPNSTSSDAAYGTYVGDTQYPESPPGSGETIEQVGVSRPIWVGDRLLLARRVGLNGETSVQGCWLDWPRLKARLLGEVTDLLPEADLVPVVNGSVSDTDRMLAGLPVRLVVGPAIATAEASPPLRWALWIGWGAVVLAAAAVAGLLHGVMALSERRAAFVSSVTHELRTPLTTFRMYAEMLSRGMVPDADRRQQYLQTLEREAERLTLLVENVLAYARLERGRRPLANDRVTVAALLERLRLRVEHRAAQADMLCELEIEPGIGEQPLTTDANIVEQIVFNLVDNAAKYARSAEDRRIHLSARRVGDSLEIAVSDHGPGLVEPRWPRRRRAFAKTAEQSAETAPGVGVGLSLCGRLARQLGGRIVVSATPGGGATVSLTLPID